MTRVTLVPAAITRTDIETIWDTGQTDAAGFERMYVAALRSIGIAARLDGQGRTELFSSDAWQLAPRPVNSPLTVEPSGR